MHSIIPNPSEIILISLLQPSQYKMFIGKTDVPCQRQNVYVVFHINSRPRLKCVSFSRMGIHSSIYGFAKSSNDQGPFPLVIHFTQIIGICQFLNIYLIAWKLPH